MEDNSSPVVTVTSLIIDPETSLMISPVTLTLELSQASSLTWHLTYIVDSAGSKHSIPLISGYKTD